MEMWGVLVCGMIGLAMFSSTQHAEECPDKDTYVRLLIEMTCGSQSYIATIGFLSTSRVSITIEKKWTLRVKLKIVEEHR